VNGEGWRGREGREGEEGGEPRSATTSPSNLNRAHSKGFGSTQCVTHQHRSS